MTTLLTAVSPDGKSCAVLQSQDTMSIRLSLHRLDDFEKSKSTLQHRVKEGTRSKVTKLLYLSTDGKDDYVAVLCGNDSLVVWDIARGVVAYTVSSYHKIWDVVESGALLVQKTKDEKKIHVHRIEIKTGSVTQKKKAGSLVDEKDTPKFCVTPSHFLVVHSNGSGRVRDQGGSKGASIASSVFSKSSAVPFVLAVDDEDKALIAHGHKATIVSLETGLAVQSWSLTEKCASLDFRKGISLFNHSQVYSNDTLRCKLRVDPDVDQYSVVCVSSKYLYAIIVGNDRSVTCKKVTIPKESNKLQTIDLAPPKEEAIEGEEKGSTKKNKRKVEVLGPSTAGSDAWEASEGSKKPRTTESKETEHADEVGDADMEEDEDKFEPEEEFTGLTLGEKLKLLQEQFDKDDGDDEEEDKELDDDDDEDDASQMAKNDIAKSFDAEKATTESLTRLLEQALHARSDMLLELALNVSDIQMVEETILGLDPDMINILITALTSRLILKPNRAAHICEVWLTTLLRSGRAESQEHIQPLFNHIQERLQYHKRFVELLGRLDVHLDG